MLEMRVYIKEDNFVLGKMYYFTLHEVSRGDIEILGKNGERWTRCLSCYEDAGEHDEIMFFIGREDKNGKKIFTGDVVEVLDTRYLVQYDKESMGIYPFSQPALGGYEWESVDPRYATVLGNKYENPALLVGCEGL